MPKIVSIHEAEEQRLLSIIAAELSATGQASANFSELTVPVAVWRKVARAAARSLKRPVGTLELEHSVYAHLTDWPATPEEEVDLMERMRVAMESMPALKVPGVSSRSRAKVTPIRPNH
jgi:hypothetical protein